MIYLSKKSYKIRTDSGWTSNRLFVKDLEAFRDFLMKLGLKEILCTLLMLPISLLFAVSWSGADRDLFVLFSIVR